jgi:hypothetical protein
MKDILDSILFNIKDSANVEIDFEELIALPEYPYPWGSDFFDSFPESVLGIPTSLKPLTSNPGKKYDLVILGYQPWYLSPSIPISSFLQMHETESLLKNTPVITVIGCRNMWTQAQEIVKKELKRLDAKLVGSIVLADRANNYVAGITVIRWLIYGKKGPSLLLPQAGVSNDDISFSKIYGTIILDALLNDNLEKLQQSLLELNAVPVKYHLVNIERNARKIFDIFAKFIVVKGKAGDPKRKGRVRIFKVYLLVVFFILSPVFSFIFMIKRWILFPVANREIQYQKDIYLYE